MSKLLAAISLLIILGCSKQPSKQPQPQAQQQASTQDRAQKAVSFLMDVPEFRELNVAMTEAELILYIDRYDLEKTVSGDEKLRSYRLQTRDGKAVMVHYRDGKCVGIQQMPRGRAAVAKGRAQSGNVPDRYSLVPDLYNSMQNEKKTVKSSSSRNHQGKGSYTPPRGTPKQ